MQSNAKIMIDDITLFQCLGKGSYGEVYLSKKEGKNELFATKKMDRKYADQPHVAKYLKNEIAILKELNHKNIVKLEDVKITQNHYYLVMEFCNGGTLTECLRKYQKKYGKPFSEEIVQYLMKQIISAIRYIHNRHIIHRDLKLDNILVHFNSENDLNNLNMMRAVIKVIDFGFATHLGKSNLVYSTLGSPINMDPTILKKMTENKQGGNNGKMVGYDQKADIWSLGTLCYEMLIGHSAFNSNSMKELVEKVESGSYTIPTNLSKEVISFLNAMLQYNAQKRLTADELARHHFLTKNVKDFEPIDVRKVNNKIRKNNLNINIKRNQTIWSIFNEEDENKLINIPGNYLAPMDSPIKEEDEFSPPPPENKRRNTEKIPQFPKFNNNYKNFPQQNNNPHPDIIKKNTQNYQNDPRFGGVNEFNNKNNNGGGGYGFPNYPPRMPPNMGPHFPNQMPNYIPPSPSIGQNPMTYNVRRQIPSMQFPTFGVPSPGEVPYNESSYGFNNGVFLPSLPYGGNFNSYGGGYGYGYGYGYDYGYF